MWLEYSMVCHTEEKHVGVKEGVERWEKSIIIQKKMVYESNSYPVYVIVPEAMKFCWLMSGDDSVVQV